MQFSPHVPHSFSFTSPFSKSLVLISVAHQGLESLFLSNTHPLNWKNLKVNGNMHSLSGLLPPIVMQMSIKHVEF